MLRVNSRFESEDEPSRMPLNLTRQESQLWLNGYRCIAIKYTKQYVCGWHSQTAKFGKKLEIKTYWKGHGKFRLVATIINIVDDIPDGYSNSTTW